MDLVFAPEAWEDYLYWQRTDARVLSRTNLLLKEITRNPYAGIGKPEPLKHALQPLLVAPDHFRTSDRI